MPIPSITITSELSGSVVARGATDELSASLLKHAGFQQIDDWYGRRHRLPSTTPIADKVAVASHATEMLRTARYSVDLSPALDTARMSPPVHPLGLYTAGAELLQITDRIRAAETSTDLRRAVDHLFHPEHGALERVREALEAAGEQVNDLDDELYALADRFSFASEFVSSAHSELIDVEAELRRVGDAQQIRTETHSPRLTEHRGAALATSPAAAMVGVNPAPGGEAAHSRPAVGPPSAPGPRR
ncbi:hypothetical protein ACWEIK_26205 [Streptomyces sp. NPDC004673]